jgi:hypothetical protein
LPRAVLFIRHIDVEPLKGLKAVLPRGAENAETVKFQKSGSILNAWKRSFPLVPQTRSQKATFVPRRLFPRLTPNAIENAIDLVSTPVDEKGLEDARASEKTDLHKPFDYN